MTLEDMIQQVILELSQVPGVGVQQYSEDAIAASIQSNFDILFREAWWPQFNERLVRTLDGVTGQVTADITTIKDFLDIRQIGVQNRRGPLTRVPDRVIPELLSGTVGRFFDPSNVANKLFTVYPLTATGNVYIVGRAKPDDFVLDSDINFDVPCLKYFTAWDLVENDGTNPAQAQKLQTKAESRLSQLKVAMSSHPIILDTRVGEIPSEWTMSP